MAKLIDSPKFGKLKVARLDPDAIKMGDIITTYCPDTDTLIIYQYQGKGNGHATVHGVVSVSEVRCYSGITADELKAIIDSSNRHTSKQRVIRVPSTISEYVLEQIPNVFLKIRYGEPTWLG